MCCSSSNKSSRALRGGASAQAVDLTVMVAALMAFYFWLERRYVVYE